MKSAPVLKKIQKKIVIDYDGYLITKYIKLIQPTWTKIFTIKMIRTKVVLINGKKVSINYRLKAGDILELYGSTKETNKDNLNISKLKPLQIVFENENLIIVDKEAKIPVQEDEKHPINNMNNRLLNHLNYSFKDSDIKWKPAFVHRLDYNTTGLLIGAKNYKTFNELTKAFKDNQIEKYYKALVHGITKFKELKIENYLFKKEGKVYIVDKNKAGAKKAITEVKLIKHLFEDNSSLLDIKLITGRTHQIRVHLQRAGHSVRGDQKYGLEKNKQKYPYPALSAYKLIFSQDIEGDNLQDLKGREFEKKDIWFC